MEFHEKSRHRIQKKITNKQTNKKRQEYRKKEKKNKRGLDTILYFSEGSKVTNMKNANELSHNKVGK